MKSLCRLIFEESQAKRFLVARTLVLLGVLLGLAGVLAPEARAAKPCCQITAIDKSMGVVTARITTTGKTFTFQVRDAWRLKKLTIGQKVYADFDKQKVSLDGSDFCCDFVEIAKGGRPTSGPCGDPSVQKALSDTCRQPRQWIVDQSQLKPLWSQFQTLQTNIEFDQPYYKEAIVRCAVVDIGMKVLEYATGKYAAGMGEGVPGEYGEYLKEYYKDLNKGRSAIPKILKGDPTWMAPRDSSAEKAVKAWDAVSGLFDALRITPEKAAKKIDDCYGKMPASTYKHAKQFVDNLKAATALSKKIALGVNNIRAKDQECWDKQFQSYKACVEYTRCKGTNPKQCERERPPGDLPPI